MPGVGGHQGVVEVAPALGRTALDQRQVVGREHRDPQRAEQVAGAPQPLAVDLDPVAPARRQLGLDQQLAALALDLGPHGRRRAPWRTRASTGARRNEPSVAR